MKMMFKLLNKVYNDNDSFTTNDDNIENGDNYENWGK